MRSYEVGLSQWMEEAGLRGQAVVPTAALFRRRIWDRLHRFERWNPACRYPLRILRGGSPFVKVELLRDNPDGVRLGPVYRELARLGYDRELIAFDRPPAR